MEIMQVELIEAGLGGMIETPNKYSIRNSSGQVCIYISCDMWDSLNAVACHNFISCRELFTAEERLENNGEEFHVGLMCCGQWRSFDIGVFDAQGNEVYC